MTTTKINKTTIIAKSTKNANIMNVAKTKLTKTKTKKSSTKKTNAKKSSTKNDVKIYDDKMICELIANQKSIDDCTINVNNELITIKNYRDQLINELSKSNRAKTSRVSKSIRSKLRKRCHHYGAMRNRTYIDQNTNKRIMIDHA